MGMMMRLGGLLGGLVSMMVMVVAVIAFIVFLFVALIAMLTWSERSWPTSSARPGPSLPTAGRATRAGRCATSPGTPLRRPTSPLAAPARQRLRTTGGGGAGFCKKPARPPLLCVRRGAERRRMRPFSRRGCRGGRPWGRMDHHEPAIRQRPTPQRPAPGRRAAPPPAICWSRRPVVLLAILAGAATQAVRRS